MKKWISQLFSVVLVIAVMVLIYRFSAQSVAESRGLSKSITEKLAMLFPALGQVERLEHYLRKLAHFMLYFILGCGLTGVAGGQRKVSPVLVSILVGTIFAASDEIHQIFSDGRGPMIQDVLLDACGVATGSVFVDLCKRCFHK